MKFNNNNSIKWIIRTLNFVQVKIVKVEAAILKKS